MQVMQASFFLSLPISEEVLNEEVKYSWNLSLFWHVSQRNWPFFRYANFAMASQILKIDMPSKRLFSFLWWGVKFCWVNLSKRHIWKSNYMSRHEMSNIDFSSMQITFVPSFLEAFLHWITFITHILIVQNAILQFHTFQPQNCNKINSLILQFYFRQNWCIGTLLQLVLLN